MKTYYWNIKKNFGDQLTPLLIKRFCHLDSEWSKPEDAELVLAGSILEHLTSDYKGVIAGCGFLHKESFGKFENARILALRGPFTRSRIGKRLDNIVLADPGLLADELVGDQDKIYDLGLVPHWTDKTLEENPIFKKYNPKIIRVTDDPLEVIKQIGQCKKIVSSSLHGIILADAFGIPRRIEIAPLALEKPKQEGGEFKWIDYSKSIDMELRIGVTQEADRNKIVEKQNELFDVFEEIRSIFS